MLLYTQTWRYHAPVIEQLKAQKLIILNQLDTSNGFLKLKLYYLCFGTKVNSHYNRTRESPQTPHSPHTTVKEEKTGPLPPQLL